MTKTPQSQLKAVAAYHERNKDVCSPHARG